MPNLRPPRDFDHLASSFFIVIALHRRLIPILHVVQRCLAFAYRNLLSNRPILSPEENMPSDKTKVDVSFSESPEGTEAKRDLTTSRLVSEREPAPWEVNFARNQEQSLILSLPDEVLLNIMKAAPLDHLFMLRQVSFAFWRLYGDESFKELHRFLDWHGRHRRSTGGFENDGMAVSRAKKNAFCKRCWAWRIRSGFLARRQAQFSKLTVHCLGCQARHSRTHFSSPMKELLSGLCVGWEGWFRVCSHERVSMPEMWSYVQRKGGKHVLLSQFPRLISPACSACGVIALGLHPVSARTREHIEAPRVILELEKVNLHHSTRIVEFKLSWTLPVFKIPKDQQVSVGLVQRHLASFVAAYGTGMFCPHVNLKSGFLLRPFDPRYCVCLGGDARLGGITPWDDRLNSQRDSGVWVTFCKKNALDDASESRRARKRQRRQLLEKEEKEEQQAFLRPNSMVHGIGCRSCSSQYSWPKVDDQVFLTRRSSGQLYEPGMGARRDDRWVKALIDPRSRGGMPDHITKHDFWCDDTACRNGRSPDEYAKGFGI
ncbi:hypothetical protein CMUS01_12025 [Colletotrichum musicola]|uniref:F-box domain-containing protein n=1 Tax=Colletotrichum musicola TaxID=2175873 RepID=A0A8H6JRX0_9PEZI|nr:hypothetical protein CMUS01_12025 [Colletotrichum musicola]